MSHSLPPEVKEQEKKRFINDLNVFINNGKIRNTFTSKRLSKYTVFNSHKIGRCLAPMLIEMGLINVISKYKSHAAVYKVDKKRLASWIGVHSN